MRKIFKILFVCCLILFPLSEIIAQDSVKICFVNGIGIKSGVTISHLIMKNSPDNTANGKTSNILTAYYALAAEFLRHKNFRLETNIGLLQRGGKVDSTHPYYYEIFVPPFVQRPTNIKSKLLFLTWNIAGKGGMRIGDYFPYLQMGPAIDYRIWGRDDIYSYYEKRKFNYSIIYGAGINYTTNKCVFSFNAFKYFHLTALSESYRGDCASTAVDGVICSERYGKLSSSDIVINVGIKYLFTKRNKQDAL